MIKNPWEGGNKNFTTLHEHWACARRAVCIMDVEYEPMCALRSLSTCSRSPKKERKRKGRKKRFPSQYNSLLDRIDILSAMPAFFTRRGKKREKVKGNLNIFPRKECTMGRMTMKSTRRVLSHLFVRLLVLFHFSLTGLARMLASLAHYAMLICLLPHSLPSLWEERLCLRV